MIVVRSTEDEGVCYVETKNLDGETNLKNKCVPKDLWGAFEHPDKAIRHFDGSLTIDGPNNLIYKLEGTMEVQREAMLLSEESQSLPVSLSNDNVLLRGMSLRNTE